MPVVDAPIPDLVNTILGGKQYISPSYCLGWAMDKACGVNPWDWLAGTTYGTPERSFVNDGVQTSCVRPPWAPLGATHWASTR